MKKLWLVWILIVCLSGCTAPQSDRLKPVSLVTAVTVSYHYGDMHIRRHFTNTDKIDIVLYYLYHLSPGGTPKEDPEQIWGDSCRILVAESNGSRHIYRQQGGRYLSVDNRPWQTISEEKSAVLFPLLLNMESDL